MNSSAKHKQSSSIRTCRFAASVRPSRGRGSSAFSLGLLVLGVLLLTLAPSAQASKAVIGVLGAPQGEGAGQVSSPGGIAVNQTGAGGVSAGDVYVDDSANNRVDEFSAAGAFVRAFGWDVVAGGPDNTGANAQQTVAVNATGGTFTLAATTATSVATFTTGSNVITNVHTGLGAFHVGDTVTSPFSGIPAGSTITAVGAESLVVSANLTASRASNSITATETTAAIPYNATATELENALTAVPGLNGNVSVSGGPGAGAPLAVEFKGGLGHDEITALEATSTELTGGTHTATVAVTQTGGGAEICEAAEADVCKEGAAGAQGGQLNAPVGIALDQANGNVFVYDANTNSIQSNKRLSVFSASGAFEAAIGAGVVASGPDDAASQPVNEHQSVSLSSFGGEVSGGTFTLTYSGETTGAINWNATAAEVRSALESLASIGAGNVAVTGAAKGPWTVEFVGTLANSNVAALTGSGTNLVGGTFGSVSVATLNAGGPLPPVETCRPSSGDVCQQGVAGEGAGQFGTTAAGGASLAVDASNGHVLVPDRQNLRIEEFATTLNGSDEVVGASFVKAFGWDVTGFGPGNANEIVGLKVEGNGGTFTLGFGDEATAPLPYNATAGEVQSALAALTAIGSGNVSVSGGPAGGSQLGITFTGALAGEANGAVTADGTGLTSGGVTVTTMNTGNAAQYEVCDVAANPSDICKKGVAGTGAGQFGRNLLAGVATSSSGAIYAVEATASNCRATLQANVLKFNSAATAAEEFAPSTLSCTAGAGNSQSPTAVTVDSSDENVIVAKKVTSESTKLYEFDGSGALLSISPPGENGVHQSGTALPPGIAAGTGERVYLTIPGNTVDIFGPAPAPTATIGAVTGVSGTTATFHGTVTPPAPGPEGGFETFYHFEYSTNGVSWSQVPIEVDASVGDGTGSGSPNSCPTNNPPTCNVTQTAIGLQPATTYEVRLVATTGTETPTSTANFTTTAAAPTVSQTVAEAVSENAAKLTSFVNPNSQPTTYHFEWGTGSSYGNRVPADFDLVAGSGAQAVKVSASLSSLSSGTTYHFRLVAENPSGTTEGPDQEFTMLNEAGLPNNRNYELVSPPNKRPVGYVEELLAVGLAYQASAGGNKVYYPINNGLEDATAGGLVRYVAERGGSEWTSTQVTPPALIPPLTSVAYTGYYHWYSPELSCGIVESIEPLTTDTPTVDTEDGVSNLYIRHEDGTYTLLSNQVPLNPTLTEAGDYYAVTDSTDDCSHVLFETPYQLLSDAPVNAAGKSGLYEWSEGTLRVAGVRPDGSVAADFGSTSPASTTGLEGDGNALSSDGSRVFFGSEDTEAGSEHGKQAIFVREDAGHTAIASKSQTATPDSGAHYMMASGDGSHVFFTANYGIAQNGTSTGPAGCTASEGASRGEGCDLYVDNVDNQTLTDLSADSNSTDPKGAGVVGVLGASEDGSYVYFAAKGQLIPGEGRTYNGNISGEGSFNVYLSHDGQLRFVGLVGASEITNHAYNALVNTGVPNLTSQVTPDGKHLLFVTKLNLTGYESGGKGEAYLYSATSNSTTCVSCRTDGLPSSEAVPTNDRNGSPIATKGIIGYTSHVPRALSNDGSRVFFTIPDVLAPGAVSGQRNLYEWENGEIYLLGTPHSGGVDVFRFVDSSTSGNDIFAISTERLAPQDTDFTRDLFDLRVGGGFPTMPPPPSCNALTEQCQPPATPQPSSTNPATESFAGPGNPPAPTSERPKKHKKHHKHKKHKKHHKHHKHKKHHNDKRGKRQAGDDRRASR